ncbi:MAG TPA: competence/damage-inducible protein A [Firmicutes bacterium]|jgi:nicotinamide-nucleotide amidase|nr:MAG: hypothetical protein AA931_02500 [Peptococcaceae bacterium 1109]HHT72617.1 competence/damage-inducible protein A [Bacillota bacterium]
MRGELVIIGTELLLGEIVDTNAQFLARGLASCGINLYYKSTVGDNWVRIVETLSRALSRSDLVIISGGLGPTEDDLTRGAVAAVANRPLELDEEALEAIEAYFRRRYGEGQMPPNNRKQAYLPRGASAIPNHWGTAPGFILELPGKAIVALPGVPAELEPMFAQTVLPYCRQRFQGDVLVTKNLSFAGIGEAGLEELLKDIILSQTNPTVAPYASQGMVRIRLTARAATEEEGEALIAPVADMIAARTEPYLFSTTGQALEEVIGQQLTARGQSLALAESCTGGLVGHRITNVAGSSRYFLRGYVVYSNAAKVSDLGVQESTLAQYGAVSPQTAQEMAEGVRRAAGADFGLAITGIAGPDGGTPEKPVGLVYIALASPGDTIVEKHHFAGARGQVKERSAQAALTLLWKNLR